MGVVGLILIFISLLPGVTSEGWSMKALPRRAISSSCVVIPCSFDFPSHSYTALHGAWFEYWYKWKYTITYTKDPNYGMATFVGRAKIIGDLEGKNCSVRIDSLRAEDSDVYYFYVDAEGYTDHTLTEPVRLQVLDVPDKPDIVLPKELQEGTPAHIICKCLYTCPDNHPNLTWSELSTSSVSNITENGGEVSAVLTFNPSFEHHGQSLSCTCDYPQTNHRVVNSVTLSVKYSLRNTSVRMTLENGNMISLSCSSDGNPAAHNFTWFKISQGKVTNLGLAGQTITVPDGFEEEISYYCEATSILGSSQSLPIRIPTECRDSSKWTLGLLTAGIMLSVFLVGIFIFICVRKRKTVTEERVSGTSDIALTPSPLSVKHQGKQNVLITEPRDTARDTTSEGETPAPRDLSEGPVGSDAGHGNPDNPDALLYINVNFSKLPSGDRTVHRSEDTEYAQIRFQKN
ncbi:sialic acid-binding Ig-like lectin 13 isoform X1 [Cetorhinus maximus]